MPTLRLTADQYWTHSDLVPMPRSEEHTSELQSHSDLVCRLLLEKKKTLLPGQLVLQGREGHHDLIVLVGPRRRPPLVGEDANDAKTKAIDLNHLAERFQRGWKQC